MRALLLAIVFRRSKVAAIAGAWVNNPYTIPFVFYGCAWFGGLLLGRPIGKIRIESWDLKTILATAKPVIAPRQATGPRDVRVDGYKDPVVIHAAGAFHCFVIGTELSSR